MTKTRKARRNFTICLVLEPYQLSPIHSFILFFKKLLYNYSVLCNKLSHRYILIITRNNDNKSSWAAGLVIIPQAVIEDCPLMHSTEDTNCTLCSVKQPWQVLQSQAQCLGGNCPLLTSSFHALTVSFPYHLPEGCQSQTNSCLPVDNFKMFLGYSWTPCCWYNFWSAWLKSGCFFFIVGEEEDDENPNIA